MTPLETLDAELNDRLNAFSETIQNTIKNSDSEDRSILDEIARQSFFTMLEFKDKLITYLEKNKH